MDNMKTRIPDLNDSEFLSFLYSERDRENNLSLYQGWNNWALAGAIITVVCFIYAAIKDADQIDSMRCIYYATGSIAFFLAYHTWVSFLKRERGHDYSRVRLMKEMTPWTGAGLAIITSIIAIVLILIYDCSSYVLWIWIAVLTVQVVALLFALINRNRVVPFYFVRPYFTRLWCNIVYDGIAGGLFSLAGSLSFKKASWSIWNPEFEVGLCIGAIAVMVYFLIRINLENKPVMQFDAILDRYLYTGISKEETYQTVLCNRMGYGVLDICKKELSMVRQMSKACDQKIQELDNIKSMIQSGQYDIAKIPDCSKSLKEIINHLKTSLMQSVRLSSRLDEIVKTAPILNQVTDINTIFDANKELCEKVKATEKVLDEVHIMVNDELDKYYCQKSNMLCPYLDCAYRNDPMDKKYARELKWRRFIRRFHLKK